MSKLLPKGRMRRDQSQYRNECDSAPSFRLDERWIRANFLSQGVVLLHGEANVELSHTLIENVAGSTTCFHKAYIWKLKSTVLALSHNVFFTIVHTGNVFIFHVSWTVLWAILHGVAGSTLFASLSYAPITLIDVNMFYDW